MLDSGAVLAFSCRVGMPFDLLSPTIWFNFIALIPDEFGSCGLVTLLRPFGLEPVTWFLSSAYVLVSMDW